MSILDSFLSVRNAASIRGRVEYKDRRLSGELEITDEILASLRDLENNANIENIWVDGVLTSAEKLPPSGTASFEMRAPGQYFETLEELIGRHPADPPEGFQVYNPYDADHLVPLYAQAVTLAEILSSLASHSTSEGCTLAAKSPLEFPFIYSAKDLCSLTGIADMRTKLTIQGEATPEHSRILDVYRSLFVQAVYDTTASVPKGKRFKHLLENFSDCMFRHNLAFRCFTDEANKAIERYEEKRAGMISSLNGVLGNIQTSLIGIPLAGLLALKEIKPADGLNFPNLVIILAVLIVGGLLFALTVSQGKTLEVIREQENHLKAEIGECGGGETKTGRMLASMAKHHSLVHNLLLVVRATIVAFILCAVGTGIWCHVSKASAGQPGPPPLPVESPKPSK